MAKIFISTLGTSTYDTVKFQLDEAGNEVYKCKFIQEGLISKFCKDWNFKEDRIRVFCTDEAIQKNWKSSQNKKGLLEILNIKNKDWKFDMKFEETMIEIPSGENNKEIDRIFEIINKEIKKDDEIYIDITYAFRSIPVLLMAMLPYAKNLKNIKIKTIVYGMYDRIQSQREGDNYVAQIIDLTKYGDLYLWANAARDFSKFGNIEELFSLFEDDLHLILRDTKGQDKNASNLRKMKKSLNELILAIQTNRLNSIRKSTNLTKEIDELINSDIEGFVFLKPFFEIIKNKVSRFEENSINNYFEAARFCVENNMYQNAYSILVEGFISAILEKLEIKNEDKKIDRYVRELLNYTLEEKNLGTSAEDIKNSHRNKNNLDYKNYFENVINSIYANVPQELCMEYNKIKEKRNDFMHAGTSQASKAEKIINDLEKHVETLESFINSLH